MVSGVLMSIRPTYSAAIFAGTKTVELRRRRPSFEAGTRVLVYSTSPSQHVEGVFEVGGVLGAEPSILWEEVKDRAGVDRATFDAYFAGCELAYAIEVVSPRRVRPQKLPIRPPQSYQFLRARQQTHRALLQLAYA